MKNAIDNDFDKLILFSDVVGRKLKAFRAGWQL